MGQPCVGALLAGCAGQFRLGIFDRSVLTSDIIAATGHHRPSSRGDSATLRCTLRTRFAATVEVRDAAGQYKRARST